MLMMQQQNELSQRLMQTQDLLMQQLAQMIAAGRLRMVDLTVREMSKETEALDLIQNNRTLLPGEIRLSC